MQSGNSSWKALAFLRKMKSEEEGFDFRIRFNKDHVPDGIVWITKSMRNNLLRFGNIIFLDAQKRQYNKLCWPYIGPVVKTNENEIRCVAESIVITEDISTYAWVLQTLVTMEPRWSLSKLKIIFADGLISDKLLSQLNISSSCVLRGDYFHLINEVFPKEHNFGRACFAKIKTYLQCMLLSKSKEEWDIAYDSAFCLIDSPRKRKLLKTIYNKASYYAGYFTNDIPGNLRLHGTSAAESNHAAIVRHFGESGAWSIVYHIKRLLERQRFYIKSDILKDDRLFMSYRSFESDFEGILAKHDANARKSLSHYAYHKLWLSTIKLSETLQYETDELSSFYTVWSVGETKK